MEIVSARKPVWANKEKTAIDLEVNFKKFGSNFIPFTASKNDCEAHGIELFNRASAGEFGTVVDYVK